VSPRVLLPHAFCQISLAGGRVSDCLIESWQQAELSFDVSILGERQIIAQRVGGCRTWSLRNRTIRALRAVPGRLCLMALPPTSYSDRSEQFPAMLGLRPFTQSARNRAFQVSLVVFDRSTNGNLHSIDYGQSLRRYRLAVAGHPTVVSMHVHKAGARSYVHSKYLPTRSAATQQVYPATAQDFSVQSFSR
jgi:hypothetical protein